MTEAEAIALITKHLESQFPKTCHNCHRRFKSLREFMANAKPIGDLILYDLEMGELDPASPRGAMAVSNCPCGSTLALTSDGMPPFHLWSLLLWAQGEMHQRGMTSNEFLQYLRWEIRVTALLAPGK